MEVKEGSPFTYKGIGISGKMCSGKTTLAEYISASMGYPKKALADALKKDVKNALKHHGLDVRNDEMFTRYKDRIRPILQQWGVLFRFFNGEDYWIERLFYKHEGPMVVDDVRFPNEVEGLRKRGFLIIRMICPEDVRLDRIARLYPQTKTNDLKHESETALDDYPSFDLHVYNWEDDKGAMFKRFEEGIRRFDLPVWEQFCDDGVRGMPEATVPMVLR